ncbi:MAG: hypothetical protein NT150_10810, partial [Bacteroidetes bacterium]|nr:hypothetical protein [Bacteroidota bacterium]
EYIDKNASLKLTINKKDNSTGLTTSEHFDIAANSDKYNQFVEWAQKNTDNWKWTPASYVADICVGQGNFRLLYSIGSNGVVIGFTDKEGKPKQYSKTIEKGNLDFLNK